jgi:starch synthase (maltosyl-transferring)
VDLRAARFLSAKSSVSRPRILYAITDLDVGGVPLHLARLAPAVQAAGWDVRVVSLKAGGPVAERLAAAGLPVEDCAAGGPMDWRVFERMAAILSRQRPDLAHGLLFHANLAVRIGGLLAGFPRRRIVTEIQTVEIERRWHLAVERLTWRLGGIVVGNSQSVVEHLHQAGGVPRERLRLVCGGVDVEAIARAAPRDRDALGIPKSAKMLAWAGRLDPIKGLDVLLSAVAALPADPPVYAVLAGDGPLRGELEGLTERLGIASRMKFLGRRDDVPAILKCADVFVFPSRTEGLPNALLEAFAAGVPVVATDAPGIRDLVTDGVTGRLVPVDDPRALAAAIGEVLYAPEPAAARAQKALDVVRAHYSLAACAERYLALYKSIL